ncbi:MAG: 16S rRNA (cytosine(967)-C(5))-methyltransferase RsmB, partial [Clostridiales bacterium]|nr:16S rRNA (cytosine(967)-C(5))-methyltransferase RsmB [Clostridiales bacterium]
MDINRKTAYKVLLRMEQTEAYSNIELNAQLKQEQPDSPGFVRELVYGVTERRLYLDFFLAQLVSRGLKKLKAQPLTILRMGLYQIMFMDSVPDYAAVDESVQLARRYCFVQAGLVNGVLRNYQRNKDTLKKPKSVKNVVKRLSYEYSFA